MAARVVFSDGALALLGRLRDEHGPLVMRLEGEDCEGAFPLLRPVRLAVLHEDDVVLGHGAGVPFVLDPDRFDRWCHTRIEVDVESGGRSGHSVETALGVRFVVHTRLFTDAEVASLAPVRRVVRTDA